MKKEQIIGTLVGIGSVLLVIFLLVNYSTVDEKEDLVACTKEAKICPDGTAVGRKGPNCEFEACPNTDTTAAIAPHTLVNNNFLLPSNSVAFNRVAYNDIEAEESFNFLLRGSDSTCIVIDTNSTCVGPEDVEKLGIDWKQNFMYLVSSGERATGGYSLNFVKYEEDASKIEIFIQETIPGKDCMTTSAVTHPLLIGTIPVSSETAEKKEVVFTINQVLSKCD